MAKRKLGEGSETKYISSELQNASFGKLCVLSASHRSRLLGLQDSPMNVSKDGFFIEVVCHPSNTLSVHKVLCGPGALKLDGCGPRRHLAIFGDIWGAHP